MKFNLVMNCYVFIEIFEFFKRSVETLCNLHNSLDGLIFGLIFKQKDQPVDFLLIKFNLL